MPLPWHVHGPRPSHPPRPAPPPPPPPTTPSRARRYEALLEQLSRGGLRYPVSGSFIWNCASWDVQGVYTSSGEGSYADPVVVERIRRHNAAAAAVAAADAAAAAEAEAAKGKRSEGERERERGGEADRKRGPQDPRRR
jgi:hypothetical protein